MTIYWTHTHIHICNNNNNNNNNNKNCNYHKIELNTIIIIILICSLMGEDIIYGNWISVDNVFSPSQINITLITINILSPENCPSVNISIKLSLACWQAYTVRQSALSRATVTVEIQIGDYQKPIDLCGHVEWLLQFLNVFFKIQQVT